MKGDKFKAVVTVKTRQKGWPDFYVKTDRAIYEYTGQAFLERRSHPKSRDVSAPTSYRDKTIQDVRSDGESAVILLEGGDKVIFDLVHDPFGPTIQTSSAVRFQSYRESRSWQEEFDEMDSYF